jgi:hypothetical protein
MAKTQFVNVKTKYIFQMFKKEQKGTIKTHRLLGFRTGSEHYFAG